MKRFLKSTAQLLLIWSAIALTLAVAAAVLAEFDVMHDQPAHGRAA